MILRPALLDDAEALAALGRESFCAAFAHLYREEDLNAFLERTYTPHVVAEDIRDPNLVHCLAEDRSGLAAFCKIALGSPYRHHSDAASPIALNQLYTAPAHTGEGLGAMLMDWVFEQAQSHGADAIQLSVWSENTGAQRFYARYGFAKIADIHFWVGNHRDDEFLFEKRL